MDRQWLKKSCESLVVDSHYNQYKLSSKGSPCRGGTAELVYDFILRLVTP